MHSPMSVARTRVVKIRFNRFLIFDKQSATSIPLDFAKFNRLINFQIIRWLLHDAIEFQHMLELVVQQVLECVAFRRMEN